MSKDGLLRVRDPPAFRKDVAEAAGNPKVWMAHEMCASIVPETWVDEVEIDGVREKMVFGVDGIVKDRWNLVCLFPLWVVVGWLLTLFPEMLCLHQEQAKGSWCTDPMHKRQMSQGIPRQLR